MKHIYTIERGDVGKRYITLPPCSCCGNKPKPFNISMALGNILPVDVGKRLYRDDEGEIHVENNNQRDRRIERENHGQ